MPVSAPTEGPPQTASLLTAFGLGIECDWPLPGSSASARRGGPATAVRRLPEEQLEAAWSLPAERLFEPAYPDGRTRFTVDRTEHHYRLWFEGFGRYLVATDGTMVGCERGGAAREWQERFLFAQALPLAAVLQGFELLHAGAVGFGGAGVAFVGPSGAGKTSVASRLVLRGARLLTDDVLALEAGPAALLAHPGPPFVVVRHGDEALLGEADRLGERQGSSDKVHFSVPTVAEALPLRVLYYLERAREVEIAPLEVDDAQAILASAFAPYLSTPERLRRHLEVAGLLSAGVKQFRLRLPASGGFDAALAALERHVREEVR